MRRKWFGLWGIALVLSLGLAGCDDGTGELICNDGVDDDGDALIDCDDDDCADAVSCTVEVNCADGLDDDQDTLIDCGDSDCTDDAVCLEVCDNGADEDLDGLIDCADDNCAGNAACLEVCDNTIDDDLDGVTDCADADCAGNAACVEDCQNGADDDLDEFIDCDDSDCVGDAVCLEICDNTLDDDFDGLTDCADADCANNAVCLEVCDNGADDDLDGLTDCADDDCADDAICLEVCDNGADEDLDGLIDCADADCANDAACLEVCGNGADDDLDGLIDCDDADCAGLIGCEDEDCANGIDDDGDALVDCADDECAAFCADACTAPIIIADPSSTNGTTLGHADTTTGSCQAGGAPDVVYSVTSSLTGFLTISLSPEADANLGVYVQTACGDEAAELGCADFAGPGVSESLEVPISAGQEVFVVVDGSDAASAGSFILLVESREVICGDGIIDSDFEECEPPDGVICGNDCLILPESLCNNGSDEDGDGLVDCEDPDCANQCVSGPTSTGDACDAADDCRANANDPSCLDEIGSGFPQGYCSEFCVQDGTPGGDCNGDALCLDVGLQSGNGQCFDACEVDADCRDGYTCEPQGGGNSACLPGCTNDAQCPGTGNCDVNSGLCVFLEICDNGADDDGDGLLDCADDECIGDATCGEICDNTLDDNGDGLIDCQDPNCNGDAACGEICDNNIDDDFDGDIDCRDADCAADAACLDSCAAPLVAQDPSVQNDDTTGNADTEEGSCQLGGAGEVVYSVTVANTGNLNLTLTSDADLGIYVRTDCGDAGTELDCADLNFGAGAVETLTLAVTQGEVLSVFVDGFSDGDEGAFTLEIQSTGIETGNCANGIDDDQDGLTDCADDDCIFDPVCPFIGLCAAAESDVAIDGDNAGDTAQGSDIFEGSCTGDEGAREQIFTFTPSENGFLNLILDSATDQGIYVRDDCLDPASEVACIDANIGGVDETLALEVEGGVPLTFFVDGFLPTEAGPFTLTVDFIGFCEFAVPALIGNNAGDTTGLDNRFEGSCTGNGPEQLFSFTPLQTGKLDLTLTSDADLGIYVRTACADDTTELDCADVDFGDDAVETLSFAQVEGGVPLTIFVDGFGANDEGTFTLNVAFDAFICGDGSVEPGEECDDQNTANGDGCSSVCLVELTETEPNDAIGQDDAFVDPWLAEIDPAGDIDFIGPFNLTGGIPGQSITVTLDDIGFGEESCLAGDIDSVLQLVDANGAVLATNDNGGANGDCSEVTFTAPILGQNGVRIRVSASPNDPDGSFFYSLTVVIQ